MKKKLFILTLFVISGTLFSVAYKTTNYNTSKLLLANIEAFASDSEGKGSKRVKHDTYGGKVYEKFSVMYEKSGVGSGCIKWNDFKALGDKKGTCYSTE